MSNNSGIVLMKPRSRNGAMDQRDAAHLAELFSALSDASRVRILAALMDSERNVGEIAEIVGISESAVSHHLRGLRHMRLVRADKRGREVYYALDDEHVAELFQRGLEHMRHG
jgi:DNA-binding transcriptional ArsR family regulator